MAHPARLIAFALLAALLITTAACGDDGEGEGTTPTPDMTPDMNPMPNPDMNPDMNPAPNNDPDPDMNPDMNPVPNPDMNPDPNPDMPDDVALCQATCTEVAACPGLVQICSEEILAEVEASCQQGCAEDEDARAQILAAAGLPCEVVEPLAIDGFGLDELCLGGLELSLGVASFSDFATGTEVAVVSFNDLEISTETLIASNSTDAIVRRTSDNEFSFLDRVANTVTVFAVDEASLIGESGEVPTGELSNPQDVVRVDDRIMITRLGLPELLLVDNNLEEVGVVDLSGVNADDTDGTPEMAQAFDLGAGVGAVLLQNLVNFASVGSAYIVLIDAANAAIDEAVELPGGNPFSAFEGIDGTIFIALIENFGDASGQVVAFDPSDNSITEGIFTEEEVGGDILAFAPTSQGFLVIVGTPDFTTNLVHVTDGGTETLIEAPGFDLTTATYVPRTNQVVVTTAVADENGLLFFDADNPSLDTAEGPFAHGELPARGFITMDRAVPE